MGWDSNPRYASTHAGFQDQFLKPLGHPSILVTPEQGWPPDTDSVSTRQAVERDIGVVGWMGWKKGHPIMEWPFFHPRKGGEQFITNRSI